MRNNLLLDIIFPRICVVCSVKTTDGVACRNCIATISVNTTLSCPRCGVLYKTTAPFCGCKTTHRLGAAGLYSDPVLKALIHALKFDCMKDAAQPLADLLSQYSEQLSLDLAGYTAIPIPLSRKRERTRGFNQSELIGSIFARAQALPFETNFIFRKEHRKPQSETKNIKERRENVRGCYEINKLAPQVPRSVLLIDDVTTSGATFREAVSVLASAGVQNIFALAVAKA